VFGSAAIVDLLNANMFDSVSTTGKAPLTLAAEYGHDWVVAKMIEKLHKLNNINKFTVRANLQLEELQTEHIRAYAEVLLRLSDTRVGNPEELKDAERILQRAQLLPERAQPATALQASIVARDLNTVRLLMKNGAKLSPNGGYLGDAVQTAVLTCDIAMVRFLLDSHVEPNCQGGFFGSPLAAAAHFGYQSIVELLVQHGAEAAMAGGYHGSVLMAAIHCGKARLVEYLLDCPSFKADPALVNRETRFGTPLQRAAGQNHIGIVQTLLDHGADINAASKLYETALQPPSRLRYADMVDYLVARGAKVDHVSSRACEALLRKGAYDGMRSLVECLLKSSRMTNVDAPDHTSNNALGYACQRGHKDIISLLVDSGADFSSKNTDGLTPLNWCIEHNRPDIIGELVRDFIRRVGLVRLPELLDADHSVVSLVARSDRNSQDLGRQSS
jgi:ankyrin repeat protein